MTKLEKATAAMQNALAHYTAYVRATKGARARLAATPEGKTFLTLRKSTRTAKAALISARGAEQVALRAEAVHPWTRFKASDSPYRMEL
jgi:hypothetical protein